MKRIVKEKKKIILLLLFITAIVAFCFCFKYRNKPTQYVSTQSYGVIDKQEYLNSLPENIRQLYYDKPEARDFVFFYNELHGEKLRVDMSEYKYSDAIPLFMQWDKRWGYIEYSGDCVAITGCGPVCLSMVAFHLTGDEDMSPDKIVEFATKNGYYQKGYGSLWTLISEGAEKLGITAEELPLDENIIINNLKKGNPIICVVGEGDFTSTGHFIVLREYKDGKIWVNDPNSYENSDKGWEYDRLKSQIKNLWACYI